ncbi:MAG: hypothetical protein KBS84_03440 [Treponema sp.]|nr:hypothetical protein [Candidatus Treponema scatequi]
MAKKTSLNLIYLIGMALVVIGFCMPMFSGFLGSANGWQFINFKNSGFVTIGALLIIVGGIAGLVACFLPQMSGMKFLCILLSIIGGVILVIGFTTNGGIYKAIGKGIIKHATFGFYAVIVGWVLGIVGAMKK